ncbi:MAG: hypothetical protein HY714_02650, partial [Candidatus Omnitrophica bacterium]|nr:hypothetical protein [Candidatus Omnitrophota bacterium]
VSGQRIFKDFFYHAGPVFPYTLAFFFCLLGFGKYAFFAHLLSMSSLMIVLVYATVEGRLRASLVLLVSASTAVGFYWHYPFPHYTHDAMAWGLVGFPFLVRTLPFADPRKAFGCGLVCGFFACVSYLTKLSVGVPFLAVYLAFFLASPFKLSSLSGYATGVLAALGSIGILIGGFEHYRFHTHSYMSTQEHRLGRFWNLSEYLSNFYWVVIAVTAGYFRREILKHRELCLLLLGSAGIAVFSLISGSIKPLTHAPLLGLTGGLAFVLFEKERAGGDSSARRLSGRICQASVAALLAVQILWTGIWCTGFAFQKFRKDQAKTILFDVQTIHTYRLQSGPMKGWLTQADWGLYLDQIVAFVKEKVPPGDSLLALPPWEMVYPLTGRESYRNWPYEVVPQTLSQRQYEIARNQFLAHPPDWIVLFKHPGAPRTVLNSYTDYLRLDKLIIMNYQVEWKMGLVAILRRNEGQALRV